MKFSVTPLNIQGAKPGWSCYCLEEALDYLDEMIVDYHLELQSAKKNCGNSVHYFFNDDQMIVISVDIDDILEELGGC